MITMFDSVDVGTVPSFANAPGFAVAGYVGGFWPTFSPLAQRFPKAHHLSIAVHADESADCLDIENGDASPAQAPAWVRRMIAKGVWRPAVYTSISGMPEVLSILHGAGIGRDQVRVWSAHYTFVAHIEPGSDATQWTLRAFGRNLDESLCADEFFAGAAPVKHENPQHYDWFDLGPFAVDGRDYNERAEVIRYDKLRKHPVWNESRLKASERVLLELAGRVYSVAHSQPRPDGRPSWNQYRRGWRFQQLIHRAQGHRFVR